MSKENETYEELYDKGFDELNIETPEIEEEETQLTELEEFNAGLLEDSEEENEEVEQLADEEVVETEEGEEDVAPETGNAETDEDSDEEKKGRTIKWNGQEIFIDEDEINSFIQKGWDYTSKTQQLAKYRNIIELIEEEGLSQEDILTLKAAKEGNTDAIGEIINKANVDIRQIDRNASYKPEVKARNYELEDVVNAIKSDTDNSQNMDQYISSVPQSTKDLFIQNPQILQGLYEDQKKGIAQKIMPEVIKTLVMNPGANFIETYQEVGTKIYGKGEAKKAKPEADKTSKKKASLNKRGNKSLNEHKDIWEDDELYEKMKRMTNPMYRR